VCSLTANRPVVIVQAFIMTGMRQKRFADCSGFQYPGYLVAVGLLFMSFFMTACIKSTRVINTPPQILQAKVLNREQLIELLQQRASIVKTLQVSSLKAHFSGGDQETGKVERYMGVPGYLLGERPASLRITLQNPVTKSSLADIVSDGKEVSLWIPTRNKLFKGPVDIERIGDPRVAQNPLANLRPQHLIPALLFGTLPESVRESLLVEEESDALAKYYVLSLVQRNGEGRLDLARRIWVERSSLNVTRERYYKADGLVIAEIRYLQYRDFEGAQLPTRLELQRPLEHYALTLEIERIKLNPQILPAAFQLARIPGAELVELGIQKP
jgi:outer membrane lipoprotein-sorting protein